MTQKIKKILVICILLLTSGGYLQAQKSKDVLKADALLCKTIEKLLATDRLKDSVAVYSFYLRLDLDTVQKGLKSVRFNNAMAAALFPELKEKLSATFDFGVFMKQEDWMNPIIVPIFIAVKDEKGGGRIDPENVHPSEYYYEEVEQLLAGIGDNYYVSYYGVIEKVSK